MKFLNLILTASLLSSTSWAQTTTVQCPATNDTVKTFRNKLLELKTAIKSDAQCAPIKADINKLGDLLTKDRPKFVDLIAQGQTEGLSEVEQGSVETYVNDLTVTTYNLLAVVQGQDACFEEDKQGSSLQFLSSVIGEGAKLLAIAGGPTVGPIIGIAGEAITGFMGAMQTIAQNRIGYKFDKNDQQIAYADSLCTLFDAKRELSTIVSSAESVTRLQLLKKSIEKQVAELTLKCPECAAIKALVDAQTNRSVDAIVTTDQVWSKDFEEQIKVEAQKVDALYTKPLGTNIYRELKTLTWIPLRIEALRSEEFNVDIVLSSAISEMDEIEEFMLQDQGPQYLDSLIRDVEEPLLKIDELINQQTYVLARNGGVALDEISGLSLLAGTYGNADEFYTKLFQGLDKLRSTTQDSSVADDVDEFFTTLESRSRAVDIKIDLLDKYCAFFQQSKWGWATYGLKDVCNQDYVLDIKQKAMLISNYRVLIDAGKVAIIQQAPPVQDAKVDWADALRAEIEAQTTDANYVERRLN